MSRLILLLSMGTATVVLMLDMAIRPIPFVVWNATQSVPLGLYRTEPVGFLVISDLVMVLPGEPLATFVAQRGYLPDGVPLIKPVLALAGQIVCRRQLAVSIDGMEIGSALETDKYGRALPKWQGCRTVSGEEVFLMNCLEPNSFDGRYFGTVPISSVLARVTPIWVLAQRV